MLNVLDFGILITYVVLVLTVGCGAAWMQKRKAAKLGVERDDGAYFLAARTLKWPIIGLSLFSTNISTVHIVALCEEGYRSGLAYANFELAAIFTLVILAVFFVPFYLRAHVTTLPDFLEKRSTATAATSSRSSPSFPPCSSISAFRSTPAQWSSTPCSASAPKWPS